MKAKFLWISLALAFTLGLLGPSPATAAIAFVQDAQNLDDSGVTSTTIAATWAAATTTGHLVVGWCGWNDTGTTNLVSVTDTRGNTYSLIGAKIRDTANNQSHQLFFSANITGGAGSVTCTLSAVQTFRRIGIAEYGGVATTTPLDGNVNNFQLSAPPTVDGVTSTSITTTAAGDLIFSATQNTTDADPGGATIISAGTGFTARTITGTGNGIGRMEDRVQAAAGAIAGTFTISLSKNMLTGVAAFKALVCAAVPDASYVAANAQSTQAIVYWSSANPVIILRKTAAFAGEAPVNGTAYTAGTTIGAATVVYDGMTAVAGTTCTATSCTQTGLTNGVTYYYEVFAKTGTAGSSCYAPGTVNTTPGVTATPASGAGAPAWSYTLAGGSILKGGTAGTGTIYVTSNASWVISLNTTSGTQTWAPVGTMAAVQGWLSWIPADGTWKYRKKVTIDFTKVSAPLTNFPVLISVTDPDLQGKAQLSGNDIFFTASDGATKLSHEIETYNSATGQLIAWVKVPSLSSAANTVLYMYYGNPSAPSQQDPLNVWDANYMAVWHLKENPAGVAPQMKDSTTNSNHASAFGGMTSANQVAGKVDGSLLFNATTQYISPPDSASLNPAQITVEGWINATTLQSPSPWPVLATKTTGTFWTNGYGLVHCDTATCTTLPPNNFRFFINDWSANIATGTIPLGAWAHVVGTYDGANIALYVNGALVGSVPYTAAINQTTDTFKIGSDGGGDSLSGQVDEVHVSNIARSAAWISTEYNNQSSPSTFYTVGAEEVGADTIVIGGDQSGRVYSLDAAAGVTNWQVTLTGADAVQAAVSVQIRRFSNAAFGTTYASDVIFAPTRNVSTTNNKIFAIRASDGAILWTFNGTGVYQMDYIVGQPWVDYTRNLLYVASRAGVSGTQPSLWVINTLNGSLVTSFALGHLETSPTLSLDGRTLYVGSKDAINPGNLYAINMLTLTPQWTSPMSLGATSTAYINGFVWEDPATGGRLYFTTADGNAWCVQDPSAGPPPAVPVWKTTVAGPGTPLLLDKLYVGSSDGKLHQLRLTDGFEGLPSNNPLQVGDGLATVGDASTEGGTQVFVGTTAGTIYKFPLPLP